MDYKKAGVDIEAGYRSVELMKKHVKETMRPEVLGGLGGFAGAFDLSAIKDMDEPVLLSGTDGCGTKVKLAFVMDKHDTIGIDAVAMCVNDIACSGGEPLFFLDYIACGKNYPEKIADIVSGVAEGCKQSECALVGGETAEHPGLMPVSKLPLACLKRSSRPGSRAARRGSYQSAALLARACAASASCRARWVRCRAVRGAGGGAPEGARMSSEVQAPSVSAGGASSKVRGAPVYSPSASKPFRLARTWTSPRPSWAWALPSSPAVKAAMVWYPASLSA